MSFKGAQWNGFAWTATWLSGRGYRNPITRQFNGLWYWLAGCMVRRIQTQFRTCLYSKGFGCSASTWSDKNNGMYFVFISFYNFFFFWILPMLRKEKEFLRIFKNIKEFWNFANCGKLFNKPPWWYKPVSSFNWYFGVVYKIKIISVKQKTKICSYTCRLYSHSYSLKWRWPM